MYDKGAILPMFYLPPVEYFVQLNQHKTNFLIENEEHFVKQTYRNRAHIYSPDGVLALTIPVVKGANGHTNIKDVKISYDFKWQRLHWLSLQNCYRRSAYFEFYEDEFAPFYELHHEYLFDFNNKLLQLLLKLTKIKTEVNYTNDYVAQYPDREDFRRNIDHRKESQFIQKPYFQLFEEKQGFLKNLSIVDLLFNHGPQALSYL